MMNDPMIVAALVEALAEAEAALAALRTRAETAERERDEADRRAGAAERQMADLKDAAFRRTQWLDKAKDDAGYHRNVSFDAVWENTLEKAVRADAAEARVREMSAASNLPGLRRAVEEVEQFASEHPDFGDVSADPWEEAQRVCMSIAAALRTEIARLESEAAPDA